MPPGQACPAVEIFTDGACSRNPGPGGWGVILRYGRHEREIYGGDPATTNNRMEMMAAIQGLESLTRPSAVHLYTDSQYLRQGITEWLPRWKRNGWLTRDKKPVKNADLWTPARRGDPAVTTCSGSGSRATPDTRRTSAPTGSPAAAPKRPRQHPQPRSKPDDRQAG